MTTENYVLGRGELYFAPFKPGTTIPDGFRFVGNCPTFNVTAQVNNLEHYRSTRGTKEKDLTIPIDTNRTAKITPEDVSPDNLALFFLGTAGIASQASATAQAETISAAHYDRLYQIGVTAANPSGVHSVSNVVVKKGTTALVAGVDYTVDTDRATITTATSSTVFADGDDLAITYDLVAKSRHTIVSGGIVTKGAFKYHAFPANGSPIDFYMPNVEMSSDGDLSLIGDQLMTVPLAVSINTLGALEAIYANGAPYVPA